MECEMTSGYSLEIRYSNNLNMLGSENWAHR